MVFSTTSGALSTSFQNWSFYFRRRPCTELEDASRSPSSVSYIRILHIHINNNTSCSHGTSTLSFIAIHIGYINSNYTLPVARPAHNTFLTFNYTRIIPSLAPDMVCAYVFGQKTLKCPSFLQVKHGSIGLLLPWRGREVGVMEQLSPLSQQMQAVAGRMVVALDVWPLLISSFSLLFSPQHSLPSLIISHHHYYQPVHLRCIPQQHFICTLNGQLF